MAKSSLDFEEEPIEALRKNEKALWNNTILQMKVQSKHLMSEEATWELETDMLQQYPHLSTTS